MSLIHWDVWFHRAHGASMPQLVLVHHLRFFGTKIRYATLHDQNLQLILVVKIEPISNKGQNVFDVTRNLCWVIWANHMEISLRRFDFFVAAEKQ